MFLYFLVPSNLIFFSLRKADFQYKYNTPKP